MGRAVDHFVALAVVRFLECLGDHPGVGEKMVTSNLKWFAKNGNRIFKNVQPYHRYLSYIRFQCGGHVPKSFFRNNYEFHARTIYFVETMQK